MVERIGNSAGSLPHRLNAGLQSIPRYPCDAYTRTNGGNFAHGGVYSYHCCSDAVTDRDKHIYADRDAFAPLGDTHVNPERNISCHPHGGAIRYAYPAHAYARAYEDNPQPHTELYPVAYADFADADAQAHQYTSAITDGAIANRPDGYAAAHSDLSATDADDPAAASLHQRADTGCLADAHSHLYVCA